MSTQQTAKATDGQLSKLVSRGKDEAQERLDSVRHSTVEFVDARANDIGDALDNVSTALRSASERIEEAGAAFGGHGTTTAKKIDQASKYLHRNEPDVFLEDVGALSRRYVGWSVGLAFIAGIALARLTRE